MANWRSWLGSALVVAGLVRAALVVFGGPLAGYGNQYDMHRTGSCLGLFPAIAAPADKRATPDAPIDLYRKDSTDPGGACYRSTEVLLAAAVASAARGLQSDAAGFRLRWLGATKFGLLALTALLLAYGLAPHTAASITHGVIVVFVLGDPAVTLWFNTLYTEFAIFWGLYASIGCLVALALAARAAPLLWLALACGLAGLAFSREQFALLPPALVLAAAPWLWRASPSPYVLTLGVAVVTSMISFGLLPRPVAVAEANRADAYLGVVLPASSDPASALSRLRLPARCASMIGASWYLQRGDDIHVVCPEVLRLPSTAFLRFAASEPLVLARATARVIPTLQSVAPPSLGTMAGPTKREIAELPWRRGSMLHAIAYALDGRAFAAMVLATIAGAFVAAPLGIVRILMRRDPGGGALLALLLGGTTLYALATTVFGDGLSESARHFLAGWLAVACAVVAFCAGVAGILRRAVREPRSLPRTLPLAVVAALGVWSIVAAHQWARTQPLAIGVVEQPAGRALPMAELVVSGWAADPGGIQSVGVELGDLKREAVHEPSPQLPFPGYPANGRDRFRTAFTAEEFARATAGGPVLLRTTVASAGGIATEIDRRTIDRQREPQAASAITPTTAAATK
ncbi:MAG TPA: hypothetical protein VM073_02370 [Usitatibacter sp.]|nr:hypothetical protein [Usitatibacter sp.]